MLVRGTQALAMQHSLWHPVAPPGLQSLPAHPELGPSNDHATADNSTGHTTESNALMQATVMSIAVQTDVVHSAVLPRDIQDALTMLSKCIKTLSAPPHDTESIPKGPEVYSQEQKRKGFPIAQSNTLHADDSTGLLSRTHTGCI